MVSLLIFNLLMSLTLSAIISATQNSSSSNNFSYRQNSNSLINLNQNFNYKLQIANPITKSIYLTAHFTLVTSNNSCNGFICYFGWLNNFTYHSDTFVGQTKGDQQNLSIFKITVLSNSSFYTTTNNNLDYTTFNLIGIFYKMINPLFSQISTLNPYLQTPPLTTYAVYSFLPPEKANTDQPFITERKTGINFTSDKNIILNSTTSVGYNITSSNIYNSFLDVIVIDSATNHILQRFVDIDYKNGENKNVIMDLQLIKNSLFTDITQTVNSLAILGENPKNIQWFPIQPNTIQLSLLNLKVP